MESVQAQLEELGMGEKEAKCYLASLALGPETAQRIAAKAGVERPTAYVAIGALTKRGLMSSFVKGKKKYYTAEKPEKLLKLVRAKKKKLAEQEAQLKEAIPELDALISMSAEKPEVKFYEGVEGLESMRTVFFESGEKHMDVATSMDAAETLDQESRVLHALKMKKQDISGRQILIFKKKPATPPLKEFSPKNWKFKIITKKEFDHKGEISIFGNHVALISYLDEPHGILIRSSEVAGICRQIFEMAWNAR